MLIRNKLKVESFIKQGQTGIKGFKNPRSTAGAIKIVGVQEKCCTDAEMKEL